MRSDARLITLLCYARTKNREKGGKKELRANLCKRGAMIADFARALEGAGDTHVFSQ